MNLFGKILTVIILILSIVVCVVAVMVGLNYKNFKSQAEVARTELKAVQELNTQLNLQKQDMESRLGIEQVARARALAELHSRQQRLIDALQQKETELAAEKQKAIESLSQSKEALARTAELDKLIAELQIENQNHTVAIEKKVRDLTALQNQTYQLNGELLQKSERVEQLVSLLATSTRIMKAHGLDLDAMTAHIEPEINASITSVSDDLVVFDVGRDDGVRVGHDFDVFRGPRYMGQVKVDSLQGGNRVVARVVKQVAKIRKDDVVKTRAAIPTADDSEG